MCTVFRNIGNEINYNSIKKLHPVHIKRFNGYMSVNRNRIEKTFLLKIYFLHMV